MARLTMLISKPVLDDLINLKIGTEFDNRQLQEKNYQVMKQLLSHLKTSFEVKLSNRSCVLIKSIKLKKADFSGNYFVKKHSHKAEASVSGRKINKERVTFMLCSNASGTDKMILLVLGKFQKPRSFGNESLQIIDFIQILFQQFTKEWNS